MKKIVILFFLFFISLQPTLADQLPEYSLHYDPQRDAFQDGRDAIKLAKESNRRILIEVGGDWCKWCHVLDRFLDKNPEVKKQLHQTFVFLKVNVSDENYNKEFLKVFPRPLGYPHMYVTEKNGNLLLSKDTADFFVNRKYSAKRFKAFFKHWAINKKIANGSVNVVK
ncbi:MAG: thioredoxin family protein [Gammaproteobacteria bacterium]|nr:thioredoxin family protein [Gammaproteobacteria bacterium]